MPSIYKWAYSYIYRYVYVVCSDILRVWTKVYFFNKALFVLAYDSLSYRANEESLVGITGISFKCDCCEWVFDRNNIWRFIATRKVDKIIIIINVMTSVEFQDIILTVRPIFNVLDEYIEMCAGILLKIYVTIYI